MRRVSVTILKAKEMGKGKEMNKTIEFKLLHVLYTEALQCGTKVPILAGKH